MRIRFSKTVASRKASLRRLAIMDLATPGGPRRKMLSPATEDSRVSARMRSFSKRWSPICWSSVRIRSRCCKAFVWEDRGFLGCFYSIDIQITSSQLPAFSSCSSPFRFVSFSSSSDTRAITYRFSSSTDQHSPVG